MRTRSTFSKDPSRYPEGYPKAITEAAGAYVVAEGKEYIDWVQGLCGAGIFGHSSTFLWEVFNSVSVGGTCFHLPHTLEAEVADLICSVLPPYAEDVRFCLNGTDATAGAVRLARAVTDRDKIVVFKDAYHGESTGDWSNSDKPPARGIPKDNFKPTRVDWNDSQGLKMAASGSAAIIFEVAGQDPTPEFVESLHWCRDTYACLLIADEVVTGFRLAMGGACDVYKISPDLACFGKALGSGVPIAAIVGKRKFIKEFDLQETNSPVFMSFTHGGNTLGLSAAKATIKNLTPEVFKHISSAGFQLINDFIHAGREYEIFGRVTGQAPRHCFKFFERNGLKPHELHALFLQKMCEKGILMGVTNAPTLAHGEKELDLTREGMRFAFQAIREAVDRGEVGLKVPEPMYVTRGWA